MKDQLLGWPIVTAANCFDVIRELGIKPWTKAWEPQPLELWLPEATGEKRDDFRQYGPKSFFLQYIDPQSGVKKNYFRTLFKPSAVVFALISHGGEEYVPVSAEWKHGNDKITIVPVAGVPDHREAAIPQLHAKMRAAALREWREETGTNLIPSTLLPLAPNGGIYSAVRPATIQYFPYTGLVEETHARGPTKYDENEHVAMIAFPLKEWLVLVGAGGFAFWDRNPEFGLEMCARDVSYAALWRLGRLQLV